MISHYYLDSSGKAWCWSCIEEDSINWIIEDEELGRESRETKLPTTFETLLRVARFPEAYPTCIFCAHLVNHDCQHNDWEEIWDCPKYES